MNSKFRRILLGLSVALALYVGLWAAAFPDSFYSSFPGLGLHWVASDGPFDEHLIRDVGGLYLGLGAASLAAIFSASATLARVVGLGWLVFDAIHLGYHVTHLDGSTFDRVGNVVSLGFFLAVAVFLVLPPRRKLAPAVPVAEVGK